MRNEFTNSCGNKRGCSVTVILPHDSSIGPVFSGVYEADYDFQEILSMVNSIVDEKLETKGQMEKKSSAVATAGFMCLL
jgi:hypothetical protein